MNVYIVCRGYDYEGFDEPEAVFDSLESAEVYVKKCHDSGSAGDFMEIFELVVNKNERQSTMLAR